MRRAAAKGNGPIRASTRPRDLLFLASDDVVIENSLLLESDTDSTSYLLLEDGNSLGLESS